MKRSKAQSAGADEEEMSSEMEVDEAKVDAPDGEEEDDNDDDDEDSANEPMEGIDVAAAADDDEDDEEEDEQDDEMREQIQQDRAEKSEFLDAFYGLAAPDPRERSVAGQVILHHAVLGPQANVSDAAYTLKRLLNGVCSGRAAARQGNASTLASFLKITKATGVLAEIQEEEMAKTPTDELPVLAYVRHKLLKATTAIDRAVVKGSRKKSAEIKDNNFGRLFGVLSIARSGILLPSSEGDSDNNKKDILETTKGLLTDLHELYNFKPYMREPAAHAVCTLLNVFFKSSGDGSNSKIAAQLVEQSIIPMFLEKGDLQNGGGGKHKSVVASYSPEQVALAMNIQSFVGGGDAPTLPKVLKKGPLKDPILGKDTVAIVAPALANTCSVNTPRTHLVWDALWLYLTESSTSQKGNGADERVLRKKLYHASESSQDVLEAIMNHVVIKELLGVTEENNNGSTHDRKALAYTLVCILSGVEFLSSLAGKTIISLPTSCLTTCVLKGELVNRLFVDVIGAGSSGKENQGFHLLRPLAVDSLKRIGEATGPGARLSLVKSLVRCDSRFDSKTKSTTVQDLLGLNISDDKDISMEQREVWAEFVTFVQDQILLAKDDEEEVSPASDKTVFVTRHEAEGLIDLLFKLSKRIIKINSTSSDDESLIEFKNTTMQQILSFLVAACFADPAVGAEGNGSKKKKKNNVASARYIANKMDSPIPKQTREVLLARLFSLLSEITASAYNSAHDSPKSAMREIGMFQPWLHVLEECKNLREDSSASDEATEGGDEDDEETAMAVSKLLASAKRTIASVKKSPSPRDRFTASMGILAAFLQLCLASSAAAPNSEIGEMSGMTDQNDSDEIQALIGEARECFDEMLDGGESESNELSRLVALCINLLSWESDDSRGASKQLVREIVKVVLPSGLMVIAKSSKTAKLDSEIADMILQSVGVDHEEENEDPEEDGDEGDESNDEEMDESGTFSKAATQSLTEEKQDNDDSDTEDEDAQQSEEDEDDEILIDNDRLNALLEEDSDVEGVGEREGKELEHNEGADAALAKFIRQKQEARKAGQSAKERVQLSCQLRCLSVLETLTNGKPESWGPLLRCDILMTMVPSLLSRISQLEKAGTKVKVSDPCADERNALMKRLASYVSSKLLKSKMGTVTWSESVDKKAHCQLVIRKVMEVASPRTVSEQQRTFCYQALPSLFRCILSYDTRIEEASALYSDAFIEWSTKKSTRINAKLFYELIRRDCTLAQSVLVMPLVKAIPAARVRFLRSECFRMLSELYNPKLNKGSNDEEKQALDNLIDAREPFIEAAIFTLNDNEMIKSKWVKDVVGTIEKVVCFASPHLPEPKPLSVKTLELLETALKSVAENANGENAKKVCELLLSKVETMKQLAPATDSENNSPEGKKAKKKKNSKKKK